MIKFIELFYFLEIYEINCRKKFIKEQLKMRIYVD